MKRIWWWIAGLAVTASAMQPGVRTAALLRAFSEPVVPEPSPGGTTAAAKSTLEPATLRDCVDRLTSGRNWLRTIPDYTAEFRKQERVGDVLRPMEVIQLKLRHAPFSVAMTWPENGRLVCFQTGRNQDRLAVRMGGWKRRLGWIHLDPHGTLALQESRYPVTDVGLLRLTEQLLERFTPYVDRLAGVRSAWLPDQDLGGRRCQVFSVDYADAGVNPESRRTIVWLDAEWSVPLALQNFDWQTGDPANPEGLLEYYSYSRIGLSPRLHDPDFTVEGQLTGAPDVAAVMLSPR